MALTKEKIQEIEAITADILREVGYENDEENAVNLDAIAEKYELKIYETEFKDKKVSGAYIKETKEIYVAKKEPYFRKLFTTAHEMGHFFLHTNYTGEIAYRKQEIDTPDEKQKLIEQEANWFAASLLMPQDKVLAVWKYFPEVNQIAQIFNVSNVAALWRINYFKKVGAI
jgi:Zn-dependent peptidase ImmA (M78 family)